MKNIAFAALAASTLLATPAFAQNDVKSTTITANIPLTCTITAPAGGAVAINATTPIGDSAATCNDPDGFVATLSSANSGVMKGQANNPTFIPYTLTIAGAGTYNLATPQQLPGGPTASQVGPLATSVNAGAANGPAYADNYSDVITYAIQAN